MRVTDLDIQGLKLIEPCVHDDQRGFFLETYRRDILSNAGIDCDFPQDNHSRSMQHTLRGMHFQTTPGQAKIVRVGTGTIFDVAVDIRPDSPTFCDWFGIELSDDNKRQLFIPTGFAHGFCVLSDIADVLYKISSPYDPKTEAGFAWNDPAIDIEWPIQTPVLSHRDAHAVTFDKLQNALP